jgi:hypothetical protein
MILMSLAVIMAGQPLLRSNHAASAVARGGLSRSAAGKSIQPNGLVIRLGLSASVLIVCRAGMDLGSRNNGHKKLLRESLTGKRWR